MRLAKQIGEDDTRCYSRKIGTVLVRVYDDGAGKIVGTGYNSPPRNTPHTDDREYLEKIFWGQLTPDEKLTATCNSGVVYLDYAQQQDADMCKVVCDKLENSKTCPRKIIGAKSGTRLECCSCAHSESNAIVNASDDLYGTYMFCYCPIPCQECSKLIINAGIKKVFCVKAEQDYSYGSRWLLEAADIEVIEHSADYYLGD